MRNIVKFYVESAVSSRRMLDSTAPQCEEKIDRVLDQLEQEFGVTVTDSSITGLTPMVLQRWFNAHASAWKPSTANNYICIINPFLRWAHTMEITEKDVSGVLHTSKLPDPNTLPPEEKPKDKYYTHEQVKDLMFHVKGGRNMVRDRAIMAMILYGGFRVSEICGLTVGQVMNVPRGSVRLRRKGGAWCDQPINEEVYKYLEAYMATRPDAKDDEPLFVTTHGQPCCRNQLYRSFASKQKVIGLATGPHALRHTAISEVNNTCGALAARDFANHKSMVVTNRYSHTTPEQRTKTVGSLRW